MTGRRPASRRTVLRGAAAAGAAGAGALGLSACSTDSKLGHATTPTPTAPVALGDAADVPVGGARLYPEQRVVVAQPAEGEFTCFSAQCTHAGCLLDKVEELEGNCPCHGSRFDVTTGEALKGPATAPLTRVPLRNDGGRLVAGPEA
ncbi:Rieske (2Fe-2S) protein [Streptomyces sp. NPDC060194]|uniref:Rieske (2Fe-2S) protein n=1 Tax=Streptomyces sp. NPDC060194 TaxID=3347069 RepID=UPI0036696BA9